jgi:hypothetical protein
MYAGAGASARGSPVRPSVEVFGSSASTGAEYLEDEPRDEDDSVSCAWVAERLARYATGPDFRIDSDWRLEQ